jgi:hypothetical protein
LVVPTLYKREVMIRDWVVKNVIAKGSFSHVYAPEVLIVSQWKYKPASSLLLVAEDDLGGVAKMHIDG